MLDFKLRLFLINEISNFILGIFGGTIARITAPVSQGEKYEKICHFIIDNRQSGSM